MGRHSSVTLGTLRGPHMARANPHEHKVFSPKRNRPMYMLEAMNGPLDGKCWRFESRIVIGRDVGDAAAALPVDRAVSRRHAQIDVSGDQLSIVDLGSSNGTIVRGEPVLTALLAAGEPFVVGRTMLRVLRAE